MNCATCRHYDPNKNPDDEPLYTDVAYCHGIPEVSDPRVEAPFGSGRRLTEGHIAATYDYEGYSSGIYVAPEFGCVLHEPVETP